MAVPGRPIFPDDELFDSSEEKITLRIPDLKRGTHLLMVRATDAAGNVGTGDALVELKDLTESESSHDRAAPSAPGSAAAARADRLDRDRPPRT